MYHLRFILLIAKLNLLVVGLPSENLSDLNAFEGPSGDKPLEDISHVNTRDEDLYLSSNPILLDSADLFSNANIDDSDTNFFDENDILWTSMASSNPCAAQADDLTPIARRDACRAKEEELVPASNLLQLFQDPIKLLNNLPSKGKQPSGSSQPPEDPNSPFYPGRLTDEEAAKKQGDALSWDLESMGLVDVTVYRPRDVQCGRAAEKYPVCCDGPPFLDPRAYTNIENCEIGTRITKPILFELDSELGILTISH